VLWSPNTDCSPGGGEEKVNRGRFTLSLVGGFSLSTTVLAGAFYGPGGNVRRGFAKQNVVATASEVGMQSSVKPLLLYTTCEK
jgi:hypothetical protein